MKCVDEMPSSSVVVQNPDLVGTRNFQAKSDLE
jgi:hypothetical protein